MVEWRCFVNRLSLLGYRRRAAGEVVTNQAQLCLVHGKLVHRWLVWLARRASRPRDCFAQNGKHRVTSRHGEWTNVHWIVKICWRASAVNDDACFARALLFRQVRRRLSYFSTVKIDVLVTWNASSVLCASDFPLIGRVMWIQRLYIDFFLYFCGIFLKYWASRYVDCLDRFGKECKC